MGAHSGDGHQLTLWSGVLRDEQHPPVVEHGEVDGLVEVSREALQVRFEDGAKVATANRRQTQKGRAQAALPGGCVDAHVPHLLEGAADAVHGGLGQSGAGGQGGQAQIASGFGERLQHGRYPCDGLHAALARAFLGRLSHRSPIV